MVKKKKPIKKPVKVKKITMPPSNYMEWENGGIIKK